MFLVRDVGRSVFQATRLGFLQSQAQSFKVNLCSLAATRMASTSAAIADPVGWKANAKLSSFAAVRMGSLSAAFDDPVEDYRALAKSSFWPRILRNRTRVSCLDVCTGTGRWIQAFSELVLQRQKMTASFDCVDLCAMSLAHSEARIAQIPEVSNGGTHCMDASMLKSLGRTFDLATNMHGLYAIPRPSLRKVISSMVERVKPGGTSVIALGTNKSFYLKYSDALVNCGVMSARYTSADDVVIALEELGLDFECIELDYVEKTNNDDELRHFLENESGGNTWPTDDDRIGKALTSVLSPNVKKLIEGYAVGPEVHHFPQSALVLLVKS